MPNRTINDEILCSYEVKKYKIHSMQKGKQVLITDEICQGNMDLRKV